MKHRSRPQHKWLQFSLRFLLLAALIIGLMLAWLASRLNEGRRHQQIARELESLGCDVEFSQTTWIPMPLAFVEELGLSNAVRRISHVKLRSSPHGTLDSAIALVKEIDALDSAEFFVTGVEERLLADLVASVAVRQLYIESATLPRTRMEWLNNDSITWLCVGRTQFSNPAIDDLPLSLTYLDATRTRINDEGLHSFVRLTSLKTLKLERTPTTGEAIEVLRRRMPWCEITWEPLKDP